MTLITNPISVLLLTHIPFHDAETLEVTILLVQDTFPINLSNEKKTFFNNKCSQYCIFLVGQVYIVEYEEENRHGTGIRRVLRWYGLISVVNRAVQKLSGFPSRDAYYSSILRNVMTSL